MIRRSLIVASWTCLVAILFFTLASAHSRPHIFPYPSLDRLAAFAGLAYLFGVAYPRHLLVLMLIMIAAAIGLELLQSVFPTRDPRFFDGIAKVIGCVMGAALARITTMLLAR